MHSRHLSAAALALLLTTGTALAASPISTGETSSGAVLTDASGMSLYIFDKDVPAVSNCYGDCAKNWPPLAAADGDKPDGKFGIVVRTDGSLQWAFDGKPLYTWVKDTQPGDVTGDGVKGVWHLAKP